MDTSQARHPTFAGHSHRQAPAFCPLSDTLFRYSPVPLPHPNRQSRPPPLGTCTLTLGGFRKRRCLDRFLQGREDDPRTCCTHNTSPIQGYRPSSAVLLSRMSFNFRRSENKQNMRYCDTLHLCRTVRPHRVRKRPGSSNVRVLNKSPPEAVSYTHLTLPTKA